MLAVFSFGHVCVRHWRRVLVWVLWMVLSMAFVWPRHALGPLAGFLSEDTHSCRVSQAAACCHSTPLRFTYLVFRGLQAQVYGVAWRATCLLYKPYGFRRLWRTSFRWLCGRCALDSEFCHDCAA